MATKKPRLTITLEPELSERFKKLSELTGTSQSALIGELLSGTGPVLDQMIGVLEAATFARESIKGRIATSLDHAQSKLEDALGLALEGFADISEALEDVGKEAEQQQTATASGSAARADVGRPSTPLSNRGVRNSATTPKRVNKSSACMGSESNNKNFKKEAKKEGKKGARNGQI